MAKKRILQDAVPNEALRTVLCEAEDRYQNELMSDEERQLLLDRIKRLRRTLGVLARYVDVVSRITSRGSLLGHCLSYCFLL